MNSTATASGCSFTRWAFSRAWMRSIRTSSGASSHTMASNAAAQRSYSACHVPFGEAGSDVLRPALVQLAEEIDRPLVQDVGPLAALPFPVQFLGPSVQDAQPCEFSSGQAAAALRGPLAARFRSFESRAAQRTGRLSGFAHPGNWPVQPGRWLSIGPGTAWTCPPLPARSLPRAAAPGGLADARLYLLGQLCVHQGDGLRRRALADRHGGPGRSMLARCSFERPA